MNNNIRSVLISLLIIWQTTALGATGIYAIMEGGWTNTTGLPQITQQNSFPAIRFGIGYLHDFNDMFGIGVEVDKGFFAKNQYYLNDGTQINIKTTALEFLFITAIHWQELEKIDLVMKVGGNRNATDINGNENNRIQPVIGIDVGYNFTPHFAAIVNYTHYFGNSIHDFSDKNPKCPSINAILAGLRITFW
ncbi:MAG: hypothetical protein LBL17_03095 [Coxiellaceae bacterium]|jgi:hypothetical protein|nr:hypothetical protein [Coxiellaceae bacterium]